MKEYQVFGRLVGDRTLDPEPIFKVRANTHKEAMKIARRLCPILLTVTTVELLGHMNPNYNPERALYQAIMNERVSESRYLNGTMRMRSR